MGEQSGGGGFSWGEEAEREKTGGPTGEDIGSGGSDHSTGQNADGAGGMSVGAGMGGFNSYNSASSISTSVDDTGSGEGSGGGDRTTAEEGSTGGRSGGDV